VKVLIECDKGHQYAADEFFIGDVSGNFFYSDCPVCHPPQAQYGPITEEMVAEMLYAASPCWKEDWDDLPACIVEGYKAEARAVIRLLNELHRVPPHLLPANAASQGEGDWWRAKLLKLARET
jgi:hypothetical protein